MSDRNELFDFLPSVNISQNRPGADSQHDYFTPGIMYFNSPSSFEGAARDRVLERDWSGPNLACA